MRPGDEKEDNGLPEEWAFVIDDRASEAKFSKEEQELIESVAAEIIEKRRVLDSIDFDNL